LIAAQQSVTAARSQEALARANGKQDLTAGASYSHTGGFSSAAVSFNIPLAVFDRNQGEIARTGYAITQARNSPAKPPTSWHRRGRRLRKSSHNDLIIQLYRGGYVDQAKQSRDISEYAYRRGAASLLDFLDSERTYRSNQLAIARLSPTTCSPSSSCVRPWAQGIFHDPNSQKFVSLLSPAFLAVALAGCGSGSGGAESKMTSYTDSEKKADTAQSFQITQEQLGHIQVVPVQKENLPRTLRLTGAVAYNSFLTSPVLAAIGGPVHEILVAPGQFVHKGQPLLAVTSPDYSASAAPFSNPEMLRSRRQTLHSRQGSYAHGAIAEATWNRPKPPQPGSRRSGIFR